MAREGVGGAPEVRERSVLVNGVRLNYLEAGGQGGRLVILLHGFPEFSLSWRHQLPALARAGYHVIAPDMRGYNRSDKPRTVDAYRMEHLTADVAGLVRAGGARAVVVGHDWGGVIAWHLPWYQPDVVDRLVILNAPHPAAFRRQLRTLSQLLRSWYVFFFQLPWLPEAMIRAGDFGVIEQSLRHGTVTPGAFTDDDVRRYKRALSQSGALSSAVNYYRAGFRHLMAGPRQPVETIRVPTLVIWGMKDRYLGPALLDGLDAFVSDLKIVRLPDASHWVQNDDPDRVNECLLGFLADS